MSNETGVRDRAPPPFIEMINGEFQAHGPQIKVRTLNRNANHPAMKTWGESRDVFDEIYVYKNHDPAKVDLLMWLDAPRGRLTMSIMSIAPTRPRSGTPMP